MQETSAGLAYGDDDSSRAMHLILAAWDEGEETGVAPEMLAYAAIFTAMTDLVERYGEEAVAGMAGGLEHRIRLGEFSRHSTRQ